MLTIHHYLTTIRLERGGVVRAVFDLTTTLARRGHRVRLLTADAADAPATWIEAGGAGLDVVELPRSDLRPWKSTQKARSLLGGADVLHLHVPWDPVNLLWTRAARQSGIPYIMSVHGMLDDWSMTQRPWKKRAYLALGGRRVLEGAAVVHCTAQAELEQAGQWFPRGKGVVLPLVLDLDPYHELPSGELAQRTFAAALGDGSEPVLLFLSRLHPKKGLDVLVDAAAMLRDRGRAFRLVIAGPDRNGHEHEVRARIKALSLDDRATLVGLVGGELKTSLFCRADLFVLPTHQENYGLVLPEAMACGTPVITTRGVDIWQELEAAGATVVERRDARSVADACEGLLADPARREAVSRQGRAWVMQSLDPQRVVADYEQLYERIAAARTRGSSQ